MEMEVNGALVKSLRLKQSWSQEMLADKAGLNLRTIQRVEAKGVASLKTRRAIAAALNIDPSELETEVSGTRREPGRPESLFDLPAGKKVILVGLYLCAAGISFGLVILDQLYAYAIDSRTLSGQMGFVFSEVADVLLQLSLVTTLLAASAIYAVWKYKWARLLLIASFLTGVVAEVFFMAIINNLFPQVWDAMSENGWSALVRFLSHAMAVILAFLGWLEFSRRRPRMAD